ncbi:hypothetical protein DS67_00400 [Mesotoga sp. SC_4PWA21]|nr:hypothetical protein DS67_00400 [Mesotoga sp. SC_4PWA21]
MKQLLMILVLLSVFLFSGCGLLQYFTVAEVVEQETVEQFNIEKFKNDDEIEAPVFRGYFLNVDYSYPELFLQCGPQTRITDEIAAIADQFNDNKNLSTIKEIYGWMMGNLRGVEGEKFGRTSHEIITTGGVTGCTDYGLAFVSLARAKGIPSVFIQTARIDWIEARKKSNSGMIVGHILVEVYLEEKWYLVDSTSGRLYLNYDRNNFSLPDGYYVFAKSIEVWDSGAKDEKENWQMMMDLFWIFDLSVYNNPGYDYIDLTTGETKSSGVFTGHSTVIGSSALIFGKQSPVELFNDRFTAHLSNKRLLDLCFADIDEVMSTQRIIVLHSLDQSATMPDYMLGIIPEFSSSETPVILNEIRDGRRIVLIMTDTTDELMKIIRELPEDFLDGPLNDENVPDVEIVKNSVLVYGMSNPVGVFEERFIKGFSRKGFLSLGNSQYERFLETELVVVLYSLDYPDKMPLYIEEYLPEFSSSELPVIVNEWREGKQIILIKTSTEAELIDLIGQLPVDFLLR